MIETLLMWLGFGLCHQLPERSFFAGGYQTPVCARDTGIYLGFIVSYVVVAGLARGKRPTLAPTRWLLVLGVALIALLAVDGLTSYAGLRQTTNEIRLATGIGAGYAMALFVVPILNGELWADPGRSRPLERPWQAVVWIATMPLVYAVTLWGLPWLGVFYPVLVAIAILATFTIVNLIIVALFVPGGHDAHGPRDLIWPISLAFGLTVVELVGAAALKLWAVGLATSFRS